MRVALKLFDNFNFMARIVYSGLVTEIKGSVGGTTFQQNRSGYIVRNKQYKGPVKSVGNVEAGRAFAIASRRWGLLTSAQRADYNTMAATYDYTDLWGNTKTLTGFQWFMASTINQFRVDGIGLPLAPVGDPTVVAPTFDVSVVSSQATFYNFDFSGSNADYLLLYASAPLKASSFSNKLSFRYLGKIAKSIPLYFNVDFEYNSVFKVNGAWLENNFSGYVNYLTLFFKLGYAGHSSFVIKQLGFNV